MTKELKQYTCGFCKTSFNQEVGKCVGSGNHSSVSSQVKCKGCGNFLKTW